MTFDQFIGMKFHQDEEGRNVVSLEVQPHHCNPTGNINGAVFLSMADNLSTGAANQAYFERTGERKFMVGIDVHAVMLANQVGGTVTAISHPVRVGRRVTVIRTQVLGEGGLLLAEVTSTHVPT